MNFDDKTTQQILVVANSQEVLEKSVEVAKYITTKVDTDIEVLAILHNVSVLVDHLLENIQEEDL